MEPHGEAATGNVKGNNGNNGAGDISVVSPFLKASPSHGVKESDRGRVEFRSVSFGYPTRPGERKRKRKQIVVDYLFDKIAKHELCWSLQVQASMTSGAVSPLK